jgi:hypothetical protein
VSDVTHILDRVQQGDPKASDELLPLVYEELRKLAAHKMANEAVLAVSEALDRLTKLDDSNDR